MMDMSWVKEIAPLVGTALGGPLGGAAAAFIADALGLDDKTVESVSDVLTNTRLSPEQVQSVKLAEIEFRRFLEQNKIDLERIDAGDRDSARKMQTTTASIIPGLLAAIIVIGFFGVLLGMLSDTWHPKDNQALLLLLGALSAGFGAVLNFYFGSSHGSQMKSEMLSRAPAVR